MNRIRAALERHLTVMASDTPVPGAYKPDMHVQLSRMGTLDIAEQLVRMAKFDPYIYHRIHRMVAEVLQDAQIDGDVQ